VLNHGHAMRRKPPARQTYDRIQERLAICNPWSQFECCEEDLRHVTAYGRGGCLSFTVVI
jgi:hypothetical protein